MEEGEEGSWEGRREGKGEEGSGEGRLRPSEREREMLARTHAHARTHVSHTLTAS
jgi:hypothetical protein